MAFYYKCGKRFYLGFKDDNGRWQRKPMRIKEGRLSFRDGRPVLDEKLAKYLKNEFENAQARQDSPIVSNAPILASALLEEYKTYHRGIIGEGTIIANCTSLKVFIDTAKILDLRQINEDKVRQFLDDRIASGKINYVTANNYIKYITTLINFGIRRKYLTTNPINGMKRYKSDAEVIPRFLSKEEIARLLSASQGETLHIPIAISIYAGLRPAEARRVQLSDIDLERDLLFVHKSKVGKPRSIPLHKNLKKIIDPSAFPLNFTNFRRVFKRIKRKAGLLDIDWYTLRHTFASHLVMNGVDLVTVKDLMGHSSIKTTMIYSHLSKDHVKESINKLNF